MEEFKIDPERLESAKQMFKNAMTLLVANDVYYDEALVYRILREGIRGVLLFEDHEWCWDLLDDEVKEACNKLQEEVCDLFSWNDVLIRKFHYENYCHRLPKYNGEEKQTKAGGCENL